MSAFTRGGYAESAVPFCGLSVIENLSGIDTDVVDPFQSIFMAQQPNADVVRYQKALIDDMSDYLESVKPIGSVA